MFQVWRAQSFNGRKKCNGFTSISNSLIVYTVESSNCAEAGPDAVVLERWAKLVSSLLLSSSLGSFSHFYSASRNNGQMYY